MTIPTGTPSAPAACTPGSSAAPAPSPRAAGRRRRPSRPVSRASAQAELARPVHHVAHDPEPQSGRRGTRGSPPPRTRPASRSARTRAGRRPAVRAAPCAVEGRFGCPGAMYGPSLMSKRRSGNARQVNSRNSAHRMTAHRPRPRGVVVLDVLGHQLEPPLRLVRVHSASQRWMKSSSHSRSRSWQ